MKNVKKYLASANTTSGFNNKFYFINNNKNCFTYILKGGPGTGKSTFMKNVGQYFENKNFDVEYFYCSSDSDSLDGVRIKNISIVDGTAPHVTEATIPQVKEKIVNVGEYIGEKVYENKKEIERRLELKAIAFKKAYLYLEALGKIFEEENLVAKHNKNLEKFDEILGKLTLKEGKNIKRELFSSFVTKEGFKTFYKDNIYKKTIVLDGNFIENEGFFSKLILFLDNKKIDYIKFSSIFLPLKTEAIFINREDVLIVCESSFSANFNGLKNKTIIEKIVKKIAFNLNEAKYNHKKVEEYYIKNMNFDGLKKKQEEIIKEIERKLK